KMHACGHDGHMDMVLGAAEAIARRRQFNGTVHLIFQPAEETVGGGKLMVEDGLFDRCPCDAVFALHNIDRLPEGTIALKDGPIMAAVDEVRIKILGKGGHGAIPEDTADPIVAGASIVMALQTVVSRNTAPHDPAVVTVGAFRSGTVSNIIPSEAELVLGIRSVTPETRALMKTRITDIARLQAESLGCTAEIEYQPSYDATVNHKSETAFVRRMALEFAGADRVIEVDRPVMGSEDFGYMLQACPGCMFFMGTGREDGSIRPLHHPEYDFNDNILTFGAGFWTYLTEQFLAG
ncbi:MAG: amidohydrolase, partial [Desulfobacterales bacterium]|nr:amidohydrolase [Desulfobacterales bacterium]